VTNTHRLHRVAAAAATAALALALAACGSDAPVGPGTEAPPVSTQPPATGATDGITQPTDVFGPACAQLPQAGEPGSAVRDVSLPVAAAIGANPLLRTLTTALNKAALTDNLNHQQQITVFAPYDRGFANYQQNLGDQRFNALLGDQNKLADILKDHVVAKRYDRAGLVAAGTVTTLQGNLTIKDAGDTIDITDNAGTTAHVLCGNIPTANATLFVVDQVLQPAKP
jgi:uncharacterized surface protein with fasciclin (FAS1) repeats